VAVERLRESSSGEIGRGPRGRSLLDPTDVSLGKAAVTMATLRTRMSKRWIAAAHGGALIALAAALLIWGSVAASVGQTALLASLLVVATVTDLRSRRIPNWATYSACCWAVGMNAASAVIKPTGVGGDAVGIFGAIGSILVQPIGPVASVIGAVGCFVVMLFLYDAVGSGGGDVKLATAIGAVLGLPSGIMVILATHLIAGCALVVWLMLTHGPFRIAGVFARSVGAVIAPWLCAPPDAASKQLLNKPVPLAGFFAIATGLTLAGVTVL